MAFSAYGPNHSADIWILPMNADGKPRPLVTSPNSNFDPVFSPDGQWLAYFSQEGGRAHVYISAYAEPDVKWLVSGKEDGVRPMWSPDGSELFYNAGNKIMVVSVQTKPVFKAGKPRVLFEASSLYYDISPDGKRFLIIKEVEKGQAQIHVVRDWFEELKRRVPKSS